MAKLKLNPEPTFKAKVGIPVPGARPVDVEFTFKYRTREQMLEFFERDGADDEKDEQTLAHVVVGWDLDDEFTPENVARLCNNYPGAGKAIFARYLEESSGARAKN